MVDKKLYRVQEAAEILSVHPRTIMRLIKEGFLASHNRHHGRKGTRVLAASIEKYIEKYTKKEDF